MSRSLPRLLLLVLALLVIAGCKKITIETPTKNGVYTTPPDIVLNYNNLDTSQLAVSLNGSDITGQFSVTASQAVAQGSAIAGLLRDGANQLAIGAPESHTRTFFFDLSGPVVHLTQVDRGSQITVTGYLEDPAGATALSIDGVAITLDNAQFTATLPVRASYSFVAQDSLGHESTTTIVEPGTSFNPVVGARLNRSGLDFLVAEVRDYVAGLDFGALVGALNPVFDWGCDSISCWWTYVNADLLDVRLYNPQAELNIRSDSQNRFDAIVSLNRVEADLDLRWAVSGISDSTIGRISSDLTRLDGTAEVTINNGDINVTLHNFRVNLSNFQFGVDAWFLDIIIDLVGWIFYDSIVNAVEDLVASKMQEELPGLIAGFLDEIPTNVDLDLLGAGFRVGILPASLHTQNNGLNVTLGGSISTLTPDASMGDALGSRVLNAPMPALGNTTPNGISYDAGAVIAVNVLNQALLAAYQAGIMKLATADSDFNASQLAGALPSAQNSIPEGGMVRVSIEPLAPPFVALNQSGAALATLQVHDLLFKLDYRAPGAADFEPNFIARLNASAPFDLGVTPDNYLQVGIEELPWVDIKQVQNLGSLVFSANVVQSLIDWLLPQLLPQLADAIGTVPIPSYAGYGLNVRDIWRADASGAWAGLAGNLIKVSTTATALAPTSEAHLKHAGLLLPFSSLLGLNSSIDGEQVTIQLAGDNPTDQPLEYRYRVDGGRWSIWKVRNDIVLHRVLAGVHSVEVCSRTYLLKESETCARTQFTVAP